MDVTCELGNLGGGTIRYEQGLDHRLRSAECVAVNGLGAEVNFATEQAVPPERIDLDAVGEESGDALVVGTADEDDLGVRRARGDGREATAGAAVRFPGVLGT